MKKILLIEDEIGTFNNVKKLIQQNMDDVEVYPQVEKTDEGDLNSRVGLIEELKKSNDESFQNVIETHKNIDLYIVDIALIKSDNIGSAFLKYLKDKHLLNNNFIIHSKYGYKTLLDDKTNGFDFDGSTQYVEKGDDEKLVKLISTKLNIKNSKNNNNGNKLAQLKDNPLRLVHWLISFFLFILIGLSIYYAGKGIFYNDIIKKEYKYVVEPTKVENPTIILDSLNINSKIESTFKNNEITSSKKSNETSKLIFIEHIFLYLLPLFVLLGFYEYYSQSIGALLNKGKSENYNPTKAMTSLNNSKMILLASLLSFSLIKAIDIIFVNKETNVITIVSIGFFILILMTYIIIIHKQEHD